MQHVHITLCGFFNNCNNYNWNQQMLFLTRPQIPDNMPEMCSNLNPTPESPEHNWLIHSPVYSRTITLVCSVASWPQMTYRYRMNISGFREGEHKFMFSYPALKPLYRPSLPNAMMTCVCLWVSKYCKITVLLHKHQRKRERATLSLANRVGWAGPQEKALKIKLGEIKKMTKHNS